MLRITTEDKILCLSCGEGSDEVLVSLEDRPELIGESCSACGREISDKPEPTINDIKRQIEENV